MFKVGIIGLGHIGMLHMKNCKYIDDVKVVAVADNSKRALKKAENNGVGYIYNDYHDLFSDSNDIDSVIISLPNFMHFECIQLALESGLNVFVEKPMANTVEECRKIVKLVEKSGRKLMVGHTMRFYEAIEKMKEDGTMEKLPKKEVIMIEREYRKLVRGLGGIRQMTSLPAVVYIVDTKKEQTAVNEARKLGIPVVAIVDTNADPDEVDHPIPGNDDAIRSIKLLTSIVAEAVVAGREISKPLEERAEKIAVPLEVIPEEAQALTEEQRIEEMGLAKVKEETEEKRIGF